MPHQPTLIRCPQCSHLRAPSGPCPYCRQRTQRNQRLAGLGFALAVIGFVLVALLLSGCSGPGGDTGGLQPPTRRSLTEIRAEALGGQTTGSAAPTPALAPVPAAIPTVIIPAALPADEVDWAAWALGMDYRWCATINGQQMLMGGPDGPRPVEDALLWLCPQR